jgi:hypothetical protein
MDPIWPKLAITPEYGPWETLIVRKPCPGPLLLQFGMIHVQLRPRLVDINE